MLLKACIILVNVSILKTQSTIPSFCMGDVCYIRVESSSGRDWTEAQQACLSSGSTLPIVDDSKHQKSFEAAARCLTFDDERQLGIWIGANVSYSQPASWTWLGGSSYRDSSIESQKGDGMTYAFVQNTSTEVRAYASYPTENHSYICHYPTQADLCKNGTGLTVENGCFVKFDEPMSWFSARNACLSNDGDLASFKNISLLEGKIGSDGVWVGLRSSQWNWQRAGIAVGLTGSPSDVTFTLWNSGEPNDATASCISTDEGDKFPNWRDCNCSLSLPFICQSLLPVLNSKSSNCVKPSTAPRHTLSSSLRSWTTKSSSAPAPSVASNGDKQQNDENDTLIDTGSVNTALAVGLGVGIGVPVILALVIVVIVISVRRKRRNSSAGENPKSRETVVSKNSKKTQENHRMEMSETQNGQPHYDNFSAASQYATIPASAAGGPKLDAPSTQGTVYADLNFGQAGPS